MVRRMFARAACAALAIGAFVPSARAQAPTLVFIVRHAEKAAEPANNPPLTAVGEVRANALADVLATAGISAIISTPYLRTLNTARPLADRLGVRIDTVPTTGGVPAHAQATADAVRKHAGKAVLVVGHSNTITSIAAALGAPKLADLCDGDYDQLFMIELPASGPPRFVKSRFGAPATDATCASMR
jgi:broad specificity phosphatase PhoE